jgi:hypothetical protein
MTDLHEAFRARLAGLLADGRALPDADLADLAASVEAHADAIAAAAAENLTGIVAGIVPEALRPAVTGRLVERIDLVPWPIGVSSTAVATTAVANLWTLTGAVTLAREAGEGIPDEDVDDEPVSAEDHAAIADAMRLRPLNLYRWFTQLHYLDDDGEVQRVPDGFEGRTLADHPQIIIGAAETIRGLIPPKKRAEVEAVIGRALGRAPSVNDSIVRLVAWFFVDETRPERLAETAARTALDRTKGPVPAEALRELTRAVVDWLPRAPKPMAPVDVVDGVHPLDEALAALIGSMGDAGRQLADTVRDTTKKTPEERAARWRPMADPLRVPLILALSLWEGVRLALRYADDDARREGERRTTVPAATIHPAPRIVIMGARTARRTDDGGVQMEGAYLPPVALVSVGEQALSETAGKVVAPLAAHLAREAWDRWVRGVDRFDWIPLPAGRAALRAMGVDATEAELDESIEWLMNAKVGGMPCVLPSPPPQEADDGDDAARGRGRPEKKRIIVVGAPLAPMGLEHVYRDARMKLPPELRFFSPVMDPAQTPLIGNRQTHARQRDFFALGVGGFLIEHRDEYAERGGIAIEPTMWRRALQSRGLYHRSHHSLVEQMWDAYRGHREPGLPGIGPRAAVLVETVPGSGVYRLGPDFADQERVILNAAGASAKARQRRQKATAARRRTGRGDS